MLTTVFGHYVGSFKGFTKEIWYLALITLINRAGTMVLPFLTKYLREDLDFSLPDIGWVMVAFGLGSLAGSYLGGRLTDLFGFYKVMVVSMLLSGGLFFWVESITKFWHFCLGIFILMSIADMFRPAMFVSLKTYSKPENRTRSLTLIRLAINLGFSLGPALGGIIIVTIGYSGLFWVDGATCILSILIFMALVKEKKPPATEISSSTKPAFSIVKNDPGFVLFLVVSLLMGIAFFQLFTILPLYYHDAYGLTEWQTGLLLSLNGFLIFLLEMPLIHWLELRKNSSEKLIQWSLILLGLGFVVLYLPLGISVLIISICVISLSEMLGFPYTNAFAMRSARQGMEGRYMAFYTMSFSMAHILSAKTGMAVIESFGYYVNWGFMAFLCLAGAWLMHRLMRYKATEEKFEAINKT